MYQRITYSIKSTIWRFARAILAALLVNFHTFSKPSVRIGRGVFLDRSTKLSGNNFINDNVRLISTEIGPYSYISPNSILNKVKIGSYVSVGPGCIIGLGIHPLDGMSTSPHIYNLNLFRTREDRDFREVIIEPDVWIGANVTIFGGLTIGCGACIGAGSVVTKSIPPYAIVYGSPAKVVRFRVPHDLQLKLLESRWWERPPSDAREIFDGM